MAKYGDMNFQNVGTCPDCGLPTQQPHLDVGLPVMMPCGPEWCPACKWVKPKSCPAQSCDKCITEYYCHGLGR